MYAYNARFDFAVDPRLLAASPVPVHLLVARALRASHTFELYARVLEELGSPARFLPFEADPADEGRLQRLLAAFRDSPALATIMVSDPFKQRMLAQVDQLTASARDAGALNLVTKRGALLVGDNLDGVAFEEGLRDVEGLSLDGDTVLFLGCGGVSSAVATRLGPRLSAIALADVLPARAERLRGTLARVAPTLPVTVVPADPPRDLTGYQVLYNGTGLGKAVLDETPLAAADRTRAQLYIDAVYTPPETAFLRAGREAGARTVNGLGHMLASTALHLTIISGRPVGLDLVRRAYERLHPAGS